MSDDGLYQRVAEILDQAQGQLARTVNTAMVQAYWIVEVEQAGQARAGYGEVITRLSARLRASYGRGFGVQNVRSMRRFCLAFPMGSALGQIHQTASGESAADQTTYQLHLPTEAELQEELTRERDAAERVPRLTGADDAGGST
ncbi:MAG: hypothetical protein KBG28_01785 [Kofleriaceae bacterium]|nr:hypothetical protein [Kofleriaceae bacterium]